MTKKTVIKATLYSNPAQNTAYLNINTESDGNVQIDIFNSIGQPVWSQRQAVVKGVNQQTIDVSQWVNGLYTVRIQQGTKNQVEKLMVNH